MKKNIFNMKIFIFLLKSRVDNSHDTNLCDL